MAKVTPLKAATEKKSEAKVLITPPNFKFVTVKIEGTAPYMSNAMSSEARRKMREGQEQGTVNRGMKKKRDPKDFEAQFKGSLHVSKEGWYGIPCSAFRKAMIGACRTVGFPMTKAQLFLFVEKEGVDRDTGEGLVRIHGEPIQDERIGKLATGVADILTRARFDDWSATVTLKWDADALQTTDVINLLARSGVHCGVGAGRPGSSHSAGIDMGTFCIAD
jgi:hypothetical protein